MGLGIGGRSRLAMKPYAVASIVDGRPRKKG
jgi:hypothetical protein